MRLSLEEKKVLESLVTYGFEEGAIKNISELGDIAKEIAKIDEVLEVHEISGEWDMLLKVKVENVKKLRDLEIEKIGRIDGIHGLYSLIAINTVKEDIRIKLD